MRAADVLTEQEWKMRECDAIITLERAGQADAIPGSYRSEKYKLVYLHRVAGRVACR
jgi:hypothetical protein